MDSVAEKDVIRLKRLRTSISSSSKIIGQRTNLFAFSKEFELINFHLIFKANLNEFSRLFPRFWLLLQPIYLRMLLDDRDKKSI